MTAATCARHFQLLQQIRTMPNKSALTGDPGMEAGDVQYYGGDDKENSATATGGPDNPEGVPASATRVTQPRKSLSVLRRRTYVPPVPCLAVLSVLLDSWDPG